MLHMTQWIRLTATMLLVGAGLAACHHRAPTSTPPPSPPPAVTPATPPPPPPPPPPEPAPVPKPLTEDEIFSAKTLDQLNAEAPLADAYFDFDKAIIRPDGQRALAQDAQWLIRWRTTKITVEGHCDERGTAEYNLALGERRAAAARDYLVNLGVAPDRIGTVSYGKESPVCRESNEACWQKNRRGHLVIVAK